MTNFAVYVALFTTITNFVAADIVTNQSLIATEPHLISHNQTIKFKKLNTHQVLNQVDGIPCDKDEEALRQFTHKAPKKTNLLKNLFKHKSYHKNNKIFNQIDGVPCDKEEGSLRAVKYPVIKDKTKEPFVYQGKITAIHDFVSSWNHAFLTSSRIVPISDSSY